MRRPLLLTTMAAAALLAGCANLAPSFERPAPTLRSDWAAPTSATATAPADIPWRDFITDDRLRQAIQAALANNRDLRVAVLNVERARALYRIEAAAGQPQLEAAAGATRQRTAGSAGSTSTQLQVQLGLASYEIDLFNRLGNLSDAALASYFAVEENRHAAQISLVAELAQAWLTLAADQARLQLAQDTLASQQASYDLTRRSQALGGASGLTVLQAQTTVDAARGEVARYRAQLALDQNALELLVGQPLETGWLPAAGGAVQASLLPALPAGLPSELLQRRPDVRAAEQTLRAANADIGAARAALYPRIQLTAAAGTQSSSLAGLFGAGSAAWSIAPRISLPIFDGGAARANVQLSEAQQAITVAQYEKTLQTAFREVADALAVRGNLGEQLAAQQSLTEASARALALSEAVFRNGASSYLEVLDAQRALYAAQQALITLRVAEQANRVTLYRVLGGWVVG
ncbi:MAG: efflux transporter outer membrane subunit [Pseudomonadota bacterium]